MTTEVQAERTRVLNSRGLQSKEACQELYAKWAASYNADLTSESQNYTAPILTAQTAVQNTDLVNNNNAQLTVLDAGCGTGLVGQALSQSGNMVIDGADFSPEMLKIANETGVYRDLFEADLTLPIDRPDGTYDIVTCCGTLTSGHVGPAPALREFVRVVKPGGIVVATVLHLVWVSGGYKAEVEKIEADGLARLVSADVKDYIKGAGDNAIYLVLQKTGSA
ncbi:S-adenosyl-L-methionine-dependent methyltransferase [Aspergillus egyptiacus]|nr:S-adenosyl-L-methionine-dependent methyltransferase [Aspergillus egyptiacus]